jgi:hypothetical protein
VRVRKENMLDWCSHEINIKIMVFWDVTPCSVAHRHIPTRLTSHLLRPKSYVKALLHRILFSVYERDKNRCKKH